MKNTRLRFTTSSLLIAVFFIAYILAAYCRGSYLLGVGVGVMYGIVATLITFLFYRALSQSPLLKLRIWLLAMFTFPISMAFAFPMHLNSDIQYSVDKQTTDRNARTELARIFAGDPAFTGLRVSTTHLKAVNVQIDGSVPTKADLCRLRFHVQNEGRCLDRCIVHWRIQVREESQIYTGLEDEDLTPAAG